MSELVLLHHNEPMTTSLAISDGVLLQHKNVLGLIRKHAESLLEFGSLAFETRVMRQDGRGGELGDVYFLNEPQSTLLITFMRNSEIVIKFKVALVKAFFDLRAAALAAALPSRDEPLTLSHRADVLVAADRTFRAAIRSGRMAGLRTVQAIRRANVITLEKTGVDMLAELDVNPVDSVDSAPVADPTASQFVADWLEQITPVPYTACRRRELYRAYMRWCQDADISPVRDRLFYAEVVRALPRMEWIITTVDGRNTRCAVPPGARNGVADGAWLAHLNTEAARFGAALHSWEGIE
jgi:phage regulator Rha-like protein